MIAVDLIHEALGEIYDAAMANGLALMHYSANQISRLLNELFQNLIFFLKRVGSTQEKR